ncbi:hypothetical protein [Streptomyces broussonetiae]|uniref:hypothetical protein n=1 Tax=Streptomyces broussonetiae TaxID=2686304 RepID=UPI0035DB0F89
MYMPNACGGPEGPSPTTRSRVGCRAEGAAHTLAGVAPKAWGAEIAGGSDAIALCHAGEAAQVIVDALGERWSTPGDQAPSAVEDMEDM